MNFDEETYLTAYIDGELTPGQRVRVESALASDSRFADDLRALSAVRDLVSGLSRPAAPSDVADAVVARIDRRRLAGPLGLGWVVSSSSWGARAAALLSAAATLVAVSTLGIFGALQHVPAARTPPIEVSQGDRPPTQSPTSRDTIDEVSNPGVRLVAVDDPNALAPGPEEHQRDLQNQRVRKWLDSPSLRKLFIVTDAIGGADRKVGEIIRQSPRRHSTFGRITVTQGIVIDPDQPGRVVVFALVMDDRELKDLHETLNASFPDSLEQTSPRPEFLTQLGDVGQMAVHSGTTVADLISPETRERERASRSRAGRDHVAKARLLPEIPGFGPIHPRGLDLEVEEPITQQDGPTPEQMRSGPHPSLRAVPDPAAPPADARPSRPQASVVLVMVTTKPRRGTGPP